ncbi:hypothetical protein [Piscinibacter koreensis]|uniref:Uncharacterized protein n=1 Tax=Piscinibacter koreensis TaxID=2742824 RepID=A0A7Y6NTL0_9BURK|nr:hypothetical protein [Schlegelella koreensis]NUZ09091.1 hypothetical protein [Schlegelella koreensis]
MALWLGRELSAAAGDATQELVLEDVAERVAEGAGLDEALTAVTKHEARAGDFGVEVAGSLVAVAVVEGLKVFWGAYLKELEEKAGKWLADKTIDYLKSKFKSDVAGPGRAAISTKIKAAIQASAAKHNVTDADLAPTLAAITPVLRNEDSGQR